jgi:ribonuclease P protein component
VHAWPRVPAERSSSAGVREAASVSLREAGALAAPVNRRHRLSRSRDFEAVYRHGRSVSTRFLVLYWFPREDGPEAVARLGLAVPKAVGTAVVRNRIKRRLRELFHERSVGLPADHDYVLVVRPGLPEAAESRGFDWLGERVDEILGKAAA